MTTRTFTAHLDGADQREVAIEASSFRDAYAKAKELLPAGYVLRGVTEKPTPPSSLAARYREIRPVRVSVTHAFGRRRPWQVVVEGDHGERVHASTSASAQASRTARRVAAELGVEYRPHPEAASA